MPNNARLNGACRRSGEAKFGRGRWLIEWFMDAHQTHREGDIDEPTTPQNREPITEVSERPAGSSLI
jgi:hypothetical protein